MPTIYDNIENNLLDGLSRSLREERCYKADFCVGYFNMRGWKDIWPRIDQFTGEGDNKCRLLVGMQKMPQEILERYFPENDEEDEIDREQLLNLKERLARDFRDQLTFGTPTAQDEKALQALARQLREGKVMVKLFVKNPLHAKLYLAYRKDEDLPQIGYLGSSNLTFSGLVRHGELNVDVVDKDSTQKLVKWFEARWEDRWCIDVSEELIQIIEESWASEEGYKPYDIYLKIMYHLSHEARSGLAEYDIPGIFRNKLFAFQEEAVKIACHHINRRNGVMIGDVVGLGKTFTASAILKVYEETDFMKALIICPANLVRMWEDYKQEFDLKCDVISIGKVQKDLPELKRYRLVVIDESHNLRNQHGKRYGVIRDYIRENYSKVILLTATPYNKDFYDLSAQLNLFLDEGTDLGVRPEQEIERVGGIHRFKAQHHPKPTTLPAFEKSYFSEDWQELMKLFLIRRTRSFIKRHYAETDQSNGRKYLEYGNGERFYFPERIAKAFEYDFDPNDEKDQYARLYSSDVVDTINRLRLARYGLQGYVQENSEIKPSKAEVQIIENLSRAGARLIGFARTNLFKRLESSGYAFLVSIMRHILRNHLFIYAIENKLPLPIGQQEMGVMEEFFEDEDMENEQESEDNQEDKDVLNLILQEDQYREKGAKLYQKLRNSKYLERLDWINSEYFKSTLKNHLVEDSKALIKVLKKAENWDPAEDKQLKGLYRFCKETYPKQKVLVFSQYADTVNYLHRELKNMGLESVDSVTGGAKDPSSHAIAFSPKSNNKPEIIGTPQEKRVLIATDVLSEGQNLQDAHLIVNYDLPWALIRLIQRAGRVDRIGQESPYIYCYSLLPQEGLEEIIRLRQRLENRIRENSEVVGADEVFFEGDPVNLKDLYNEEANIMEKEEDEEVDLSSYAYQVWKEAIKENPELDKKIRNLPNVIYSTKKLPKGEDNNQGVITFTRTGNGNDLLTWVNENKEIVTQSQLRILSAISCRRDERKLPRLDSHHDLVEEGVRHIYKNESELGGQLGTKNSIRYKIYTRLDKFYEQNKETLFVNHEIKRAIEDIYQNPLREIGREIVGRKIREGATDQDLADLVINLRDENRLVVKTHEETTKTKQPKIICSMGLSKNQS